MKKPLIITSSIIIFALGVGFYFYNKNKLQSPSPTSPTTGVLDIKEGLKTSDTGETLDLPRLEIVAENLEIPWEVAYLPSGEILVTERPGRLIKIGKDKTIIQVSGVRHVGEGVSLLLAVLALPEDHRFIAPAVFQVAVHRLVGDVETAPGQTVELRGGFLPLE